MLELVYRLNLPPLTEILLPGVAEKLLVKHVTDSYLKVYDPTNLVKPEWLNFNGFNFNFVNFFYKDDFVGLIHTDGPTVWAINWIHNGSGIMEYWKPEDIKETVIDYIQGQRRLKHIVDVPPFVTYNMTPGAYLVNAMLPHRASGSNSRWAFSLRAYNQPIPLPWDLVIDRFKEHIV